MGLRADTIKLLNKTHPRPNVTLQEPLAIRELKLDHSKVILTADKGVAMVVMDSQDNLNKAKNC